MTETIGLVHVLPDVFKGSDPRPSMVWLADVEFRRGQRYLIEADSGTGKTSLCAFLNGMRFDYQGSIFFDGCDVSTFGANRWAALRRNSLAWLPQEIGLFPQLTLMENIEVKNRLTSFASSRQIAEWIDRLGLSGKIDTKASKLSIGQQQRVAFIRMLCQPADFFILDEPVSHLDEGNNRLLARLLEERLSETGAGVIVTSVGNRMQLDNIVTLTL